MIDPTHLASLEKSIKERITAEWPGVIVTPKRVYMAGEVREGGATEALIALAARIAVEEFNKF